MKRGLGGWVTRLTKFLGSNWKSSPKDRMEINKNVWNHLDHGWLTLATIDLFWGDL